MNEAQALEVPRNSQVQAHQETPHVVYYEQSGDNAVQIGNVGNLTLKVDIDTARTLLPQLPQTFNLRTDFYHLFVVKGFKPELHCLSMEPERALMEDMSPNAPQHVRCLDTRAIDDLKEYPALFMDENAHPDRPNRDQFAYLGRVTDVVVGRQIQIFYELSEAVQQLQIHELSEQLGIIRVERGGELRRTHWALKEADLRKVLYP